jgi:hypothetical protein
MLMNGERPEGGFTGTTFVTCTLCLLCVAAYPAGDGNGGLILAWLTPIPNLYHYTIHPFFFSNYSSLGVRPHTLSASLFPLFITVLVYLMPGSLMSSCLDDLYHDRPTPTHPPLTPFPCTR